MKAAAKKNVRPHGAQITHLTSQKPSFYGQHWISQEDGKHYAHVKGRNNRIVFPSQAYTSVGAIAKLFKNLGWPLSKIEDPNAKPQKKAKSE